MRRSPRGGLPGGVLSSAEEDHPVQLHFDGSFSAHNAGALDAWRAATDRVFYGAGRRVGQSPRSGAGRLASMELGGLRIVDVTVPPGASARDRRAIAADGVDALFVSTMRSGHARLETDSRLIVQHPGDLVTWDAARQHRWVHEIETQSFCVRIPRQLLHVAAPERLGQRALAGGSPLGALASTLIAQLARVEVRPDSTAAHRLRSSLVDTLVAALDGEDGHPPRSAARGELLARAKAHMLARLDCAGLSPAQVAAAVGASPRSLARAFAQEATTPARWLWQQRLARAREMLLTRQARSVSDAAVACGFASLSHFSRAFRQAHGEPPERLLPPPLLR